MQLLEILDFTTGKGSENPYHLMYRNAVFQVV